jgi:hypothetical protein
MPPLLGFSDNSFTTRADAKKACISLLQSLQPYQSPGGARIRLPLQTGTHFDDIAAQLEGYARALWAIGALIHGGNLTNDETKNLIQPYVYGLANGTDPDHPEYWGPVVVRDQRMVEMEIISYALLSAPDVMFHNQELQAQKNISSWLGTINGKDFPTTNWLWFRVMTNLALVKVCGIPHEELRASMEEDLNQLERFYMDEGWAADGTWSDDGRQADYYSGSFAIQFSQLLYVKMAEELDPKRCARYREYAALFAASFWRYFDTNGMFIMQRCCCIWLIDSDRSLGAAIAFGRSLTYRFAFAGFWSVAAFTEVDLPAPLNDWGVVKGLLLRHFRWWTDKHDMFNVDGALTIGFTYPNMYMSEDYNSPQSPYWAMKSFVALGLPETHAFWTAEEKPLPQNASLARVVKPPMHIVCHTGNHHFLLSAGQFCPWPLKATEAKYGKFAYSSHFSFSVPTGPLMPQMAPDSTIAVSKDGGDTWRVPWKVHAHSFGTALLVHNNGHENETISTLKSSWKPWKDSDVEVSTILVAPCSRWPDWYIRLHQITSTTQSHLSSILITQGGFSIQGRRANAGQVLSTLSTDQDIFVKGEQSFNEGTLESSDGALICSNAGASGISPLHGFFKNPATNSVRREEPEILKPDANTNLIWQRTLIPTIQCETKRLADCDTIVFVTGVFAIGRSSGKEAAYDELDIKVRWEDRPVVVCAGTKPTDTKAYISLGMN